MSFSSNVAEQREKQEKVLNSFLVLSFIGSAVLHIAALTLGSLWFKTPKLTEKPIEVIVVEPSSPKAVKIKQVTPPKDKPVPVKLTTPKYKTIAKSLGTSGAAIRAIASGSKSGSGTTGTPSTLLSNPVASIPSLKQNTTPRKQSKPVKTASKPKTVLALKPKPNLSPLDPIPPLPSPKPTQIPPSPTVAKTLPPLPTLKPTQPLPPSPTVAKTLPPLPTLKPSQIPPFPKIAETLPPLPTSEPTQTPLLKPTSKPKAVQTNRSRFIATESPKPTATPKPTSTSSQLPFPTSPSTAKDNNVDNNSTASRSSIATAVGNKNSGGNSTHDSSQGSNSGNGALPGSGNGSGNTRAIATGNRNGRGNGSGSDGLACRRCPAPDYPSGSEGIEGRAVVAIDVEKDGSVRDVQMVHSTGHDNLDQRVMETVLKKWKFVSTDSEQHIQAAVNFAKPGSNFYHQARERERNAHELQQQRRRERPVQTQ